MKKILVLLVTIFVFFGCSNESPPIEVLKNSFLEKVEKEMESMNCLECSGLYNFRKGQIYKSNDSIYYFVIDKVTHLPYTQDLFSFNINSFSTISSDENLSNVYKKNKLVTEVSNTEFYEYLITKNYPNNDKLNIIDTINQSSLIDESKEKESWLNSSLSRGIYKDIFEFNSINIYYGDWELIVNDLSTGGTKTFRLVYQNYDDFDPEIEQTLYETLGGETPQFEILNIFEKLTFENITNSVYSSLITKETPPSDVFKFDFVPIKIKVLHNGQSCFFIQRVKHNPLIKPVSLSFQETKNNLNYEYDLIEDFQTEIEGKPLFSFLVSQNSDYGSILWFNDINNIKPFFSYGHKLSEVKTLWKELYKKNSNQQSLEIDCSFRDETFIKNKMKQLNNDVTSIQKVGDRKYFVQYVNWDTGLGESGSKVLDYSNSPCD
jgi:hypothetical protein